ncbi:alpha/beta hydrolase [Subtercola frigoramans]|uniref:Enterochelin esterase-like enzyme n=1 Tax=Subtercola frigoramans TaxID=120298 RepID=A0ABS2L268_9MICO|nr:esterase [Subtercola frigoramans]MBM7470581.1 enterochelin esterase-like enzyme [Subtercola frigoramans]
MNGIQALLNVNIVEGPVVVTVYVLSSVLVVFLLARVPLKRFLRLTMFGLLGGAAAAVAIKLVLVDVLNTFGSPVSDVDFGFFVIGLAAIGLAVSNAVSSTTGRKVTAAASVITFALATTLAINQSYGLNPTVAAFLHINTDPPLTLVPTTPNPVTRSHPAGPLYATWVPPAGMPSHGTTGQLTGANAIPNSESGFPARNAEVYYPPAALVDHPPALPFVLMMMGQPGDPSAKNIAKALDAIAAKNNGLAPIVIVADQLADPTKDPLCLDSSLGKAETYLMKDVTRWARAHLNILGEPKSWTIAGYSNGGECANYFGSKYPAMWGNILDISGIEYAGVEQHANILKTIFAGNQTAYDSVKPAIIMTRNHYPDTTAIYTAGEKDPSLIAVQKQLTSTAINAGIVAKFVTIPGADHGVTALDGGLTAGFELLFPRLGLSRPTP